MPDSALFSVVRPRAEVLHLRRMGPAPRTRGRSRPAPRPAVGRRRSRWLQATGGCGDPTRMSTATEAALPTVTRISFPMGGSHWKWRPRTTFAAEREWLSWTNAVGSPSASKTSFRNTSLNQPRSLPNAWGDDQLDVRDARRLDRGKPPGSSSRADRYRLDASCHGRIGGRPTSGALVSSSTSAAVAGQGSHRPRAQQHVRLDARHREGRPGQREDREQLPSSQRGKSSSEAAEGGGATAPPDDAWRSARRPRSRRS